MANIRNIPKNISLLPRYMKFKSILAVCVSNIFKICLYFVPQKEILLYEIYLFECKKNI